MITEKRYRIACEAERASHIRKKDMNILFRRFTSAGKIVEPFIKRIESLLNRSDNEVLDIGSGPTCLGRFFNTTHKTYLDPLMDFYRDYYNTELPYAQGSSFVNAMAETTPFANDHFDAVLCYNMLDHAFNPVAIIGEIKRVLKPKGYLLMGIYTHGTILKNIRTLGEKLSLFRERPHPHSFTICTLKALLNTGFIIKACEMIKGKESLFCFRRRFYVLILQKA